MNEPRPEPKARRPRCRSCWKAIPAPADHCPACRTRRALAALPPHTYWQAADFDPAELYRAASVQYETIRIDRPDRAGVRSLHVAAE